MSRMKSISLQVFWSVFVCALLWTSWAVAQDKGVAPADRMQVAKKVQKLSPSDMKTRASTSISAMKDVQKDVANLLQETQGSDDADIEKVSCINDKLTSIKGFLNVSEQSKTKMDSALDSPNGDRGTANHQFVLIDIAKTKVSNLGVEAQSCAGEILRYSGKTELGVDVSDNIAQIDPTNIRTLVDVFFRLPEATPYQ